MKSIEKIVDTFIDLYIDNDTGIRRTGVHIKDLGKDFMSNLEKLENEYRERWQEKEGDGDRLLCILADGEIAIVIEK